MILSINLVNSVIITDRMIGDSATIYCVANTNSNRPLQGRE
ncbi:hypothetical protein RHI63_08115 [Thermosynechococcus sp. GLH187]|nr:MULTISPECIES: hypothetical protein [unclassified Thermosynechococcus]WNC44210.1 hypothetical protein RHI63_08115 [Thermosynechococcus sp. GLH187]WNC46746.1 hypothetical protein RHI71_08115 [Thermosynechococcus sp. GLH333]WNC49283.1 hypothetical protein RHI73_08115 [Thermosynechococcus sp. GLH87]